MKKAIIFDFWGVICNDQYYPWLVKNVPNLHSDPALSEYFVELARRGDRGEITSAEFYEKVEQKTGISAEKMLADWRANLRINQELLDFVQTLRQNYKTAVISNTNDFIDSVISDYGIANYFDELVLSYQVKMIKPDPKIFEYTLNKLESKPEEAIFTDDNPKNIDAAAALGIQSVLFTGITDFKFKIAHL